MSVVNANPVVAVVVAYEHGDMILPTLRALSRCNLARIVVWDNSSDPSLIANIMDSEPFDSRFEHRGDGENYGFGHANNRAWQSVDAPEGSDLLLVNPDCMLDDAALSSLRGRLDSDYQVGIVAPSMEYPDGRPGIAGGHNPSSLREVVAASRLDDLLPGAWRQKLISVFDRVIMGRAGSGAADSLTTGQPIKVDWVSGFCMLIRGSAIKDVGLFDESFFLYFEDVDLCTRFRTHGYSVILDRHVRAIHDESSSTRNRGKSKHYYGGLATYMGIHGTALDVSIAKLLRGISK